MDLYQELILDHSKHPRHAGLRTPFEQEVHHVNTSCGDEITLRVHCGAREGDTPDSGSEAGAPEPAEAGEKAGTSAPGHPLIADVSYDAIGCSIMTASASVMAELVHGQPLPQSGQMYEAIKAMLTSKGQDPGDEDLIGDGIAFAGVSQYPARVKCALLPWSALADALAREGHHLGAAT